MDGAYLIEVGDMASATIEKLKSVKDFESLIEYLKEVLYWPIEAKNAEDITFDYNPLELGIDSKHAAKIKIIKQIRPLTDNQPWGLFYVEFEPKRLPVVVLRRILKALIHSRRHVNDRLKTWDLSDLIFISSLGETEDRQTSFAHFSESEQGLSELRTFSWDASDTNLHYLQNILDLETLRWPENEHDVGAWHDQWSSAFTMAHRYVITTSRQLAVDMARLAKQIRDQVKIVYEYEVSNGPLHKLFEDFKNVLIYDLEIDTFADMYAQTITYGLFSAKATHEGEFAIKDIPAMIPNTNPFLKNLFEECTRIGENHMDCLDLDELGVTELIKMLKDIDIEAILQDFGRQKRGEDPVIHFYEDFLKEYNPKQKVKRGVFYTSDPIVSFIIRSVDYLLRTEFDCPDGLADISTIPVVHKTSKVKGEVIEEIKEVPKVQILDLATGTGTFLKYVIEEIKKTFDEKHKDLGNEELRKEWNRYVNQHLLSRLFGFELMMAPYSIAHLKLGLKLAETGYDFQSDKRLEVYLTNTLEGTHKGAGTLDPYLNWLAEEVHSANTVKEKPISVIIGNPPYSVSSLNKGPYIERLMNDYKKDVKDERNIQPLSDDYIKFIRVAHKCIDDNGFGIIAMITNNSYLSGIIHRGMRKKLLDSFDRIYILNLHGSLRIEEPTEKKDENVFDIQQGVSIALFVKNEKFKDKKIFYADSFGKREDKYRELDRSNINSIGWQELKQHEPYYFFVPKDFSLQSEYDKFWKITDIFDYQRNGITTGQDEFFINFDKSKLRARIQDIFNKSLTDSELSKLYKLKSQAGMKLIKARKKCSFDESLIKQYDYRPFDNRWIYKENNFLWRSVENLWNQFENKNVALVGTRLLSTQNFYHTLITDKVGDYCLVSNKTKEFSIYFPLYFYNGESNENQQTLDEKPINSGKKPNFTEEFIEFIDKQYPNQKIAPEDILGYVYAVLHSPTYRDKFNEFLKIDFPRIPFVKKYDMFKQLSEIGKSLVNLHLMRTQLPTSTKFDVQGSNVVKFVRYKDKDGKVYINDDQCFDGISEGVWDFHIGGYQVLDKWVKDRKGRTLTEEDIEHYQKIVVAINETIKIMKEIDEVIEEHGGWPIQ